MEAQQKEWFIVPEDMREGILSEECGSNGGLVFRSEAPRTVAFS